MQFSQLHRRCSPAIALVFVSLWLIPKLTIANDDKPASKVVERLQSTLLEVMKDANRLGYQGRYARLEPIVSETHDFTYILRAILGESAAQLTPAQLTEAADEFRKVSIATYAREFDGYSGETFTTLDEKANARGSRLVRSVMQSPSGTRVSFDYVLHQSGGEWRIINTIADGVSQLATDRTQVLPVLKEQGFSGLMNWIRSRQSGG